MQKIKLSELRARSGIGFGTSGIRGLATSLSTEVVYCYTKAFIEYLKSINDIKSTVAIAGDLRESTDRIMATVAKACNHCGIEVVNCGKIPTPAITYYGLKTHMPSIMVTGSHIPANMNGVKFNLTEGEVLKKGEAAITAMEVEVDENKMNEKFELPMVIADGRKMYVERFVNFFGTDLLKDKKIGLYGHSAVGRDMYVEILEKLGASVTRINYSNDFVPIDTENVDEKLLSSGLEWQKEWQTDFIISTDGDGDRPLLAGETGRFIKSEFLPIFAAKFFGIEELVTTITSNTLLEKSGWFKKVVRTKVGSPYVIEKMIELIDKGGKKVAAYEANGGFLLGNDIDNFSRLHTRDALPAILGTIALAKKASKTLEQLIVELPKRFSYASSIKGIPTVASLGIIDNWEEYRGEIEETYGRIVDTNLLDGLRLTFENGDIVHFRPSMNAPEFRNYTEADSYQHAKDISMTALELIKKWTK